MAGITADDTSGDVTAQTKDVLRKIDAALAAAGTNKSKVLSAQCFITDIAKWEDMNMAWDTPYAQLLDRRGFADSLRLENRHVVLHRKHLDRGRQQFESPSRRLVGLRHTRQHMVLRRLQQHPQRRDADFPCANEDQPHASAVIVLRRS